MEIFVMDIIWISYGYHMDIIWTLRKIMANMDVIWISYFEMKNGCNRDIIWTLLLTMVIVQRFLVSVKLDMVHSSWPGVHDAI